MCKAWRTLAVIVCLAMASPAYVRANTPAADVLQSQPDEFRVQGQGRMRWFGLLLYEASLWVAGSQWQWERPFALDIRYARDFAGERLADTSVSEMQRIGWRDPDKLQAWREQMRRAFPDVRKGSHLTGLYRPGTGVEFYHDGRLTASVRDPEFARAFFSIWLDPRTREPALRAALLGAR